MKTITCDWINWLTKILENSNYNINGSKLKITTLETHKKIKI